MSIAVNILSRACGREVRAGDFLEIKVDYALGHDLSTPLGIKVMEGIAGKVWDPGKMVLVFDHYVPAPNAQVAMQQKLLRQWAGKQGLRHFYDAGCGVCHQVVIEEGIASPGLIIAGADSHTCSCGALGALGVSVGSTELGVIMATGSIWLMVPETIQINLLGSLFPGVSGKDLALYLLRELASLDADYKAIEFIGEGASSLSISDRVTVCNMMAEAGAKTAIFQPDEKVESYLYQKNFGKYEPIYADGKAEQYLQIDLAMIEPMVAIPYSPILARPVSTVDLTVDQAYLGSCTNGRIEDLRIAADILKGKRINCGVRLLINPASRSVFQEALQEGLVEILTEAGAQFVGCSCGACFGGHLGLLAEGERCISTSNRNFPARMGHAKSEVYLASPATVAASALYGKMTDARRLL